MALEGDTQYTTALADCGSRKVAVSVLLPVYNCERFLEEAIRSILTQTFKRFQLVIVNDGSTDKSLDIAQRLAEDDNRLIVVNCSNGGIVRALNTGLLYCTAPFLARMDADDVSFPERLDCQMAFLCANPEVGVVGSQVLMEGEKAVAFQDDGMPTTHEEICQFMVTTSASGFYHPTVLMRRSLLEAVGGYRDDYRYAEDLDLFLRLADVTRFHNLQSVLLRYRRHSGAVGVTRTAWQARSAVDAIVDAERRRKHNYSRSVARHAYRASWTSGDEGEHHLALRYALLSIRRAPQRPAGWRALARCFAKKLHLK